MTGSSDEEIRAVSQLLTRGREDRIIGFEEEDRRARQRSSRDASSSFSISADKLALFGSYKPLELPGIELHPGPSKALELMHRLASDPGIIAVMKKHGWKVGIMSELAPEGYVGISPECVLGFNKNHGEEISLRLRTDDLKGFRKYDSIKKTLMHELAHMVYGEHDENFHQLDKQLNREVVELDWTRRTRHTLIASGNSTEYSSEDISGLKRRPQGIRLGGDIDAAATKDARSAAAVAALTRLSKRQESENTDNLQNSIQKSNARESLVLADEKNETLANTTPLHREILKLKEQASPAEVNVALHTLSTIIGNALNHPDDAKFHRLRMKNPNFQNRVARFQAALEVLRLAGFSEAICEIDGAREECLIWNHNDPRLLSLANTSIQTFLE